MDFERTLRILSENCHYHDGDPSPASRVFIGKDLIGQLFLYYIVSSRSRLFCVSCTKTSRGDLNLSTLATLPAKDAAYLPALQMIAVLEPAGGVVLYTGTALIGKLHVAGISTALASPSYLSTSSIMIAQLQNSVTNTSHHRRSLLSSTVVGDAAFDEKVHLLSPVAPSTSNNVDFATPTHVQHSTPKDAHINSLRDPVANRLTLEFLNGTMFRVTLPNICSSPLVSRCLEVLKSVLPRDVALQVIVKWCGARNAPGTQDFSPTQEWQLFETHLLGLLGYNIEKLPSMKLDNTTIPEAPSQILRKKRASYCGSDDDWDYLLSSQHHGKTRHGLQSLLALSEPITKAQASKEREQCEASNDIDTSETTLDTSAMLFRSMHLILYALHLLYEDLKLNMLLAESLPMLARLLHQLAADLRMNAYVEHYWRDFPTTCPLKNTSIQMSEDNLKLLSAPIYFTEKPSDVMKDVYHLIIEHCSVSVSPYPVISSVNQRSKDIIQMIGVLCTNMDNLDKLVQVIIPSGIGSGPRNTKELSTTTKLKANSYNHIERVVFLLSELGYTTTDLSSLPSGIALVLNDAIHRVRENPPTDWPEPVYRLIGRQDLAASLPTAAAAAGDGPLTSANRNPKSPPLPIFTRADPENEDGMETMLTTDYEILKLRFSADHRVAEVRSLLQSSRPVTISIPQRPEFSDHEFIEEQEKHLYAICTRTMALPVGRGMVTLHTVCRPVASEPLAMPRLCLSGKAPPRDTTVDLSHIEVVPNMNLWPLFHNGVAAGLRVSPAASNVNSPWIVYNKPKGGPEVLPEHAGFLMALGLNGHLSSLVELNTFKYLSRCHEMTSVGLILGISATKRGTMDVQTTKLLSVHIESLLPPTSIELDIVQNIQVAALLGVGLVYQKTAHRHIAEVLLAEIGRPPGPEMENSVDRESYSLSAGLALGLVVLGTGSSATGLADLGIADTLHHYMVGGNKRPGSGSQKEKYKSPSYQIKEGDEVNIDVTAPGATLALGMMFFNSGNKAVANWMKAPDTQFLLDFVCPDLLLLRILARGLILWDEILPTEEWVESHVPDVIRPYCLVKPVEENIDYETMNQAYCNIIAGACMAMGLKFAGSANNEAFTTLLTVCKVFTTMFTRSIAELAGKSTIETCLNVVLLSLAMVMAGTGELEVMRLCRYLRWRVRQGANSVVTYGSHLATHMALGLLFLGGGRYTLSTSAESVAALLCAFFPKFPTHSNDNRYHLQAFRHLYVLAATPRLLLPRDIDSGNLCYAHLTVVYLNSPHYSNQTARLKAPCLLPELNLLKEVRVEDDRYWSIVFRRDENWNQLEKILAGCKSLHVKQRAGCLSYCEDPHGFRSLLAHTLTSDKVVSWSVPAESIFSFSSKPSTLNFVRLFLECENSTTASSKELKQLHFLTKLVFDCVTHDKMSILVIWLSIMQGIQLLTTNPVSAGHFIWQLKHVIGYAVNLPKTTSQNPSPFDGHHDNGQKPYFASDPLISAELALTIKQQVSNLLDEWQKNDIKDALISYMKCEEFSASDACMAKLAMYVMFHNIPSPSLMSQVVSVDGNLINPVSVALMLNRSENNLTQNKYNHLAMLIKRLKTVN
ncbi:hypothetical protein LSTR_LSTR003132 [Laodelphax striatellus]|uniref:Uncharacterized protein n=1 Tax=Laodelphax striatellus TaxID=195883 RepID=A0A482WX32_LAOST|nr:hypothetical protein LSTR_LSTR003132 [Laodelphax striatellus]